MQHVPVTPTQISSVSPFLIIRDLSESLLFYRDALGFEVTYSAPADDPFFAVVRRDGVEFMLKVSANDIPPKPNPGRHPWAPWDAFIYTPDPDALAAELDSKSVPFSKPLADTEDGLRGFELTDPNGYVFFCGKVR